MSSVDEMTARVQSLATEHEIAREALARCERAEADAEARHNVAAKATAEADAEADANPTHDTVTRHGVALRLQKKCADELAKAQSATATGRVRAADTEKQLADAQADAERVQKAAEARATIAASLKSLDELGRSAYPLLTKLCELDEATKAEFEILREACTELAHAGEKPPCIEQPARFAGIVRALVEEEPTRAISIFENRPHLVAPLARLLDPFSGLGAMAAPRQNVRPEDVERFRALVESWVADQAYMVDWLEAEHKARFEEQRRKSEEADRKERERQAEKDAQWERGQRELREAREHRDPKDNFTGHTTIEFPKGGK